jgi:4-amino-4-deoxy-L-arabinose transferase-like glycosyltransferase
MLIVDFILYNSSNKTLILMHILINNYIKKYTSFIFWLALYLVIHFTLRLSFNFTLQVDDAEQIQLSQELLLGYPIPQPPMYSWFTWILFQIFGTGLLALTLLKYIIISLTFWFTWLTSGQLFQHLQTRYIATFSYLLLPSFAWHMHQGFTHTILLGLGIILSLHALLLLKKNDSIKSYLYLGFSLGIGLMAKYSFLLFMIPLLLSAISIASFRKVIINQKILISISIFILIIGPHVYWLTQHYQEIFLSIDQKLKVTSDNLLFDRLKSVGQFSTAAISFVTPFTLIFVINSWRKIFNIDNKAAKNDSSLLLNRFYFIIIVSVILLDIFVSMPHFKVRWLHPLMMIFPLWMLTRIERNTPLSKSIMYWFTSITVIFTVLILSIRIAQVTIGPELGNYGRLNRPIIETFNKLPAEILKNSVIKTEDGFIGSHLLSHYQQQNIIINNKNFRKNYFKGARQCLWLWDNDTPYIAPKISKILNSGQLITMVADTKYTLFYALSPKQECN